LLPQSEKNRELSAEDRNSALDLVTSLVENKHDSRKSM